MFSIVRLTYVGGAILCHHHLLVLYACETQAIRTLYYHVAQEPCTTPTESKRTRPPLAEIGNGVVPVSDSVNQRHTEVLQTVLHICAKKEPALSAFIGNNDNK
jgi:hypothetical protein